MCYKPKHSFDVEYFVGVLLVNSGDNQYSFIDFVKACRFSKAIFIRPWTHLKFKS